MSMTLSEFEKKYLGKSVEYHSYGATAYNQCVDLVNQYINECLDCATKDYTELIGTDAKDFATKYDPDDFDFIKNTPEGVPMTGDIIIWNGRVGGGAGHVAICRSADVNTINSLDQNWSVIEKVTLETHPYTNVSGWLHPKAVVVPETIPVKKTDFENMRRKCDIYDWMVKTLDILDSETVVKENINKFLSIEDKVAQLEREKGEMSQKADEFKKQLAETASELKDVNSQNATLTKEVEKNQKTIDTLSKDVKDLEMALQELKDQSQKPVETPWYIKIFEFLKRR